MMIDGRVSCISRLAFSDLHFSILSPTQTNGTLCCTLSKCHWQTSSKSSILPDTVIATIRFIIITIIIIRHWDRSMNLLLTSFESWGAGSPVSLRRSDSLPIYFRGCQSLCSDTMQSFCMTAFHQAWTSGHRWNSFGIFKECVVQQQGRHIEHLM